MSMIIICLCCSQLWTTFSLIWFYFSEPIGGEITVTAESGMTKNTPKTAMEKALDEQLKTSRFSTPVDKPQRKGCYYTSVPRVIKRKGIHGQELTSLNLDKASVNLCGF